MHLLPDSKRYQQHLDIVVMVVQMDFALLEIVRSYSVLHSIETNFLMLFVFFSILHLINCEDEQAIEYID
jgi:hypothetical protein